MNHVLCFSREIKESHIGTNVEKIDSNLFPYLEKFFGFHIDRVIVVENGQEFTNQDICGIQLELF